MGNNGRRVIVRTAKGSKTLHLCCGHRWRTGGLASGSRAVLIVCRAVHNLFWNSSRILEKMVPNLRKIIIGDGEQYKRLNCTRSILNLLLKERIRKDEKLISWGGGVVGDLVGFVASCYMRGTGLRHFPTTLLSQTDSSIGGKTGINSPIGKNTIGTFYPADDTVINTLSLSTLPQREWCNGLCEVIKMGICFDADFFRWIEINVDDILARRTNIVVGLVRRACEIKAFVASKDDLEKGIRSALNFGHTFGHAIELTLCYTKWSHAEAVSCGMMMAAEVSTKLGLLQPTIKRRLGRLLALCGLPLKIPNQLKPQQIVRSMLTDKKNTSSLIQTVLLKSVADALILSFPITILQLLAFKEGEDHCPTKR